MDIEQLIGRYRRLQDELAAAYDEKPWPTGRIDRLAHDIAATEQAILSARTRGAVSTIRSDSVRPRANAAPIGRNRLTPFGPVFADSQL